MENVNDCHSWRGPTAIDDAPVRGEATGLWLMVEQVLAVSRLVTGGAGCQHTPSLIHRQFAPGEARKKQALNGEEASPTDCASFHGQSRLL